MASAAQSRIKAISYAKYGYMFILPFFIVYFFFQFWPLINTFILSFKDYKGDNFIRCADCGILTRGNKNGTKRYCKDCSGYTPQEMKTVVCVDCGEEFQVSAMANRTSRCQECYKEYRKKYKSQKELERYYKNKNI